MPTQHVSHAPRVRGFTLLELLVVLVLLMILAGLVAPRLAGSLAGVRVGTAAERVFAAAREGRGHAVLRGLRARLVLDFERGAFWLEEERRPLESPGVWTEFPGREGRPHLLPDGVRFEQLLLNLGDGVVDDARLDEIPFQPDGTSHDALLTIANEAGDRRRIEVRGITGHVRIVPE